MKYCNLHITIVDFVFTYLVNTMVKLWRFMQMANNKMLDIVEGIARPIVEELGLELVDIEYVREGTNWYLRVYIDKDGGITLDDCESVSRPLGKKLDEIDPISQAYFFEVSSPGVERPFKKIGRASCRERV